MIRSVIDGNKSSSYHQTDLKTQTCNMTVNIANSNSFDLSTRTFHSNIIIAIR